MSGFDSLLSRLQATLARQKALVVKTEAEIAAVVAMRDASEKKAK